jgi:hypothetical protein
VFCDYTLRKGEKERVKILAIFDNTCFAKKISRNLMSQQFIAVDLKHLCVLEIGVFYRKLVVYFYCSKKGVLNMD